MSNSPTTKGRNRIHSHTLNDKIGGNFCRSMQERNENKIKINLMPKHLAT